MTRRIAVMLGLFTWLLVGPALTAQPKARPAAPKGRLTTHVLNTASGKPAAGVKLTLERQADKGWEEVGRGRTGDDGRAADVYPADRPFAAGVYRLVFDTGAYFKAQGHTTFFPRVEVIFEIEKENEHYHVPLLLSPFGYTTYRGS